MDPTRKARILKITPRRPVEPGSDSTQTIAENWRGIFPQIDLRHSGIRLRLIRLGALMRREHDVFAETQLGIQGDELRILFALRRSGTPFELRPRDLFKSLFTPSATMTRQLDRLEKEGLAQRAPDPGDRRGVLIRLTQSGAAAVEAATRLAEHSLVSQALDTLGEAERTQLEASLARLMLHVEKSGDTS